MTRGFGPTKESYRGRRRSEYVGERITTRQGELVDLLLTKDEKDAIAGTNGAPSAGNKFVTNSDPRNTDQRDAKSLQGRTLSAGAPSDGDAVKWNAALSRWEPGAVAGGGGGGAGSGGSPWKVRKLIITNDAVAPNSKVVITSDALLIENVPVSSVVLTADIAAAGANGLDTGAEAASTWYAVWVIAKADGTVASLLSVSFTAPTMPTGYTRKRRVGAIRNDGSSNFYRIFQVENICRYIDLVSDTSNHRVLSAGVATVFTTLTGASRTVPPPSRRSICRISAVQATGAGFVAVRPTGSGVTTGVAGPGTSVNGEQNTVEMNVDLDGSQQFDYKTDTGALQIYIDVVGYVDFILGEAIGEAAWKTNNLRIANDTVTPLSKVVVTADLITVGTLVLATVNRTIDITVAGQDGLDTGAEAASTWYAIWLIAKDDGTVRGLLSVSFTAPTMPTDFVHKRRVGAVRNNGSSNFYNFFQQGEFVVYNDLIYDISNHRVLAAGSATVFTAVTGATRTVPPPSKRAWVRIEMIPTAGSQRLFVRVTGSGVTNGRAIGRGGAASGDTAQQESWVDTDGAQSFDYRMTSTGTIDIDIHGYVDPVL